LSAADFASPDATGELFDFGRSRAFRGPWLETLPAFRGLLNRVARQTQGEATRPATQRLVGRLFPGVRETVGGWQLLARHRAGSLEAAVAGARWRNIAIGIGILALLAVSGMMLIVSTQRAQELARQKIEFVAGVSHELRTPLAVMRSAGENLAHGTIEDHEQVKRYGSLIEKEGRRLSDLVDQILTFAGAQSAERTYTLRAVTPERIIDGALSDCQSFLEGNDIQVDKHVPADLPQVMADPPSLQRAVHNLLVNAIKYGGRGGWLGIVAKRTVDSGGAEVSISIQDRGPGIARSDLPHLFEPFYRGREAAAAQTPGSGLGLSLVRHIVEGHGGRVSATSSRDAGACFTIHIPAVFPSDGAQAPSGDEGP